MYIQLPSFKPDSRKPLKHLLNILTTTKDHHPNFTLFLGAGASATSGVKTAFEMIRDWRLKYTELYCKPDDETTKLERQSWFKSSAEYSILFELLYDQPTQRREYIESAIGNTGPSWGYIYLVNLLEARVFNTVFTTNFDDLLNEACYLFSSRLRPIVCAHDSSIRSIRITSRRPKVIKLHGDFLFDSIKNTLRELESLEDNMRDKFRQYAPEAGLIVVGYSGHDRSIMDTLGALLRSDYNFPHGIYWCVRKGSEISQSVHDLARFPRFTLVEIDGFDELFAEMHSSLGLELQREMSDPYEALTSRLNNFLEKVKVPSDKKAHPLIEKDIALLAERLSKYSEVKPNGTKNKSGAASVDENSFRGDKIPYRLLADIARRSGKYEDALQLILAQLRTEPSLEAFETAFKILEKESSDAGTQEVISLLKQSQDLLVSHPGVLLDYAVNLMRARRYDGALSLMDLGFDLVRNRPSISVDMRRFWLNKALITRLRGQTLSQEEQQFLAQLSSQKSESDPLSYIAAEIILGNTEEAMFAYVNHPRFPTLGNTVPEVMTWPLMELVPEAHKEIVFRHPKCPVRRSRIEVMQRDHLGKMDGCPAVDVVMPESGSANSSQEPSAINAPTQPPPQTSPQSSTTDPSPPPSSQP